MHVDLRAGGRDRVRFARAMREMDRLNNRSKRKGAGSMKKVVLSVVAALAFSAAPALAADMPAKAPKVAPAAAPSVGRCIRYCIHDRLRSARRIAVESQACSRRAISSSTTPPPTGSSSMPVLGIEPVDRICRCRVRYHGRRAVYLGQLRPRSRLHRTITIRAVWVTAAAGLFNDSWLEGLRQAVVQGRRLADHRRVCIECRLRQLQ